MRDGWRQPRNCLTPEVHCFLKFTDHQIHPVHVSIHIRGVTDPSESVLDRVLLTGVIWANRMRPSLVQKQRKALFFYERMGRGKVSLYSTWQAVGRAALKGSSVWGGRSFTERRSCAARASACSAERSLSARGSLPPPPSWIAVWCTALLQSSTSWGAGTAVSPWQLWSEVPGVRPLHAVSCEQVKLDEAQRKKRLISLES